MSTSPGRSCGPPDASTHPAAHTDGHPLVQERRVCLRPRRQQRNVIAACE